MPFTAGSTADLADAVLALGFLPGASNSSITLDLESNSSGVPGTVLGTLTQQGTIPSASGPVTFDYSGTPAVELISGTSYWLVALQTDANSYDVWSLSNSDNGTFAFNASVRATGEQTNQSFSHYVVEAHDLQC
ncbi:MAG: choice-of-anchor R domain-containing protein [Terriglobia bacterium]